MEAIRLSIKVAAFFCVHHVSSQTYIASNGPFKSWSDAQAWSTNNQSHLVEIKNDADLGNMAQFIRSSTLRGYIALNAQRTNDASWRWISGTDQDSWITIDNQASSPTYTSYVNINRTLTYSNGLNFTAELPTSSKGFICQYTDCSNHPGGWSFNGRCFVAVSSPTYGWFDASNYCIRNGGTLAQFDGKQSSMLTSSALIQNLDTSMAYWIGLIRFPWKWQYSDTSVIYSNWANFRQFNFTQQCLAMYYNSPSDMAWYEVSCQSSMAAICEKNQPPTPSPVTTASPTSSMQPISSTSSNSGTITNTMPSEATFPTHLQPPSTTVETVEDSSTTHDNLALALGVGIGGGVGLIIIIIVVAAILCARRRREIEKNETAEKSNISLPDISVRSQLDESSRVSSNRPNSNLESDVIDSKNTNYEPLQFNTTETNQYDSLNLSPYEHLQAPSVTLYEQLEHQPASEHECGDRIDIYENC